MNAMQGQWLFHNSRNCAIIQRLAYSFPFDSYKFLNLLVIWECFSATSSEQAGLVNELLSYGQIEMLELKLGSDATVDKFSVSG